jgi:hypothetical protein
MRKISVLCDVTTPCDSCRNRRFRRKIASIFRVKDHESPSLAARVYINRWGREPLATVSPLSYLSVTVEI